MRAVHMARVGAARPAGDVGQLVENAAVGGVLRLVALLAQALELLFQQAQPTDARSHMADVRVQQGVDIAAVAGGGILEAQQRADLVQRHVQAPAMPYERQACGLGLVVDAVVAPGAGGLGQQALAFVIPDGFDRSVGQGGQLADFHGVRRRGGGAAMVRLGRA